LSIKKRSSILNIHIFEANKLNKTVSCDFSKYRFSNADGSNLYDILNHGNLPLQPDIQIAKIDEYCPSSLEITSNINKLYINNDKIYLTLDINTEDTKLITFNLADNSTEVNNFLHDTINGNNNLDVNSNSYLFGDNILQIIGSSNEIIIKAVNRDSKSLIKKYRISKSQEIDFKNTSLLQEGGTTTFTNNSNKELNNSEQILRKISNSSIGISAYVMQDMIELTIGGYKEVEHTNTSSSTTFMTGPNNNSVPLMNYHNPLFNSYTKYTNTRTVYFKSLLDKTSFCHVTDSIPNNAFDKIKIFESHNDNIKSKTIFRLNDYYVFGYYDTQAGNYYFRRFDDY
jgi:hypothetical protein